MKKVTNNIFSKFEIESAKKENNIYYLILEILQIYNCRISEILSAKWTNFDPNRFLILEGLKKSRNVIIRDRIILNKINSLTRVDNELIFKYVSYYSVYHFIKTRLGNQILTVSTKKNKKVTHFFRYKNIKNIDNDKKITDILNHRSEKSVKYYKNKIRN